MDYSEENRTEKRSRKRQSRFSGPPIIPAVLIICLVLAGVFWFLIGPGSKGAGKGAAEAPRTTEETTAVQEETGVDESAEEDDLADIGGPASETTEPEDKGDGSPAAVQIPGVGPGKPEEVEPEEISGDVTLGFAGDIYFSDYVLQAYDSVGGPDGILDGTLREAVSTSDFFVANQEFPFSNAGTPAKDKEFTFRISPDRVHIMQEIGTDCVTLANNHVLDYGAEALVQNNALLDAAGIRRTGAGAGLAEAEQLVILEAKGKKIGILAGSRVYPDAGWAAGPTHAGVLSAYDPGRLIADIQKSKAECDYLAVAIHWGIEKKQVPENYQKEMGHKFIDAGADIVIGSHPHVLQGIEYYAGKPILYSMGNFIFNSSIPETMLGRITFKEDGSTSLQVIPAVASGGRTAVLPEAKREAFFQKLQGLSFGVTIDSEGYVNPIQ